VVGGVAEAEAAGARAVLDERAARAVAADSELGASH
jgi:hypothetical protein